MAVDARPRLGPFERLLRRAHRRRQRDRRALAVGAALPPADADRLADALEGVLLQREPVARRAEAAAILEAYTTLNAEGRRRFFERLAQQFATVADDVDHALAAMAGAGSPTERVDAERQLRRALTPRYARLFHVFTGLPNGVKLLVDLRADLLACRGSDPALRGIDDELAAHLSTVFDVGLLQLHRITWESPAALLEKLIAYEAVHEIRSWDELKHRLHGSQRCFAFLHPAMPDEPLVFVEVALTHGLAGDMSALLGPGDGADGVEEPGSGEASEEDTAIFYSITSCQPGLAGVQLGNELIKHVVEQLRRDLPGLRVFATLSPIPGFRRWADTQLAEGRLTPGELAALGGEPGKVAARLAAGRLEELGEGTRTALMSMCARYLTTRRNGRSADSVANFHLSNGARIERLHWRANTAPYEIERSYGIMVNYRYDPGSIAANAEAYLRAGHIQATSQVRDLVR
ncbi:MAG TPA: malonyl-CoA decarboxylase family protein [Acidimicrobiales bacterium]|nr:malonyl-CoA decarboxylase family protein [Acidimicrobiales bacterium]